VVKLFSNYFDLGIATIKPIGRIETWQATAGQIKTLTGENQMAITKHQVDLCQGQDDKNRDFGYVAGDDGGFFFTWMDTLEETLDSIDEDEQDGDGDLDESEVRDFLESYLPTTRRGQKIWGSDGE
jgi:hypothetical protein